jgi:5-amino-6-(5-phosphoribosylamino)uracil reductase
VAERPYVLLSVAMSVDGCIDDATGTRLILSNDADLDRVDEVRAGSDAILVGAGTIRRDNPALLVRSQARRRRRAARGLPESPVRVTLTGRGNLDPSARFFTAGEGARLIYGPAGPAGLAIRARLDGLPGVEVIEAGDPLSLDAVLADLVSRGVRRLMVEGGGSVLAQFLAQGLTDELDLVIAPVFVGDPAAPRIVGSSGSGSESGPGFGSGSGPGLGSGSGPGHRMHLAETRLIGDVVLMRYLPGLPGNVGAPFFR